jgi:flagellar hook-associated protein 2
LRNDIHGKGKFMSSLSTSLYGATTNKGVGGLLSGLDTDDLVKQMTAATRNKINRQYQSKQKLLYRQEAYREVSKKLLAFSDKYFSYSSGSKTNILSSKFFEANTIKSSSSYVNVTGNAQNVKNFSIDSITSVASAASFASSKRVSSDIIGSSVAITDYTSSIAGGTMTLEYGGKSYNLTIDKRFGNSDTDQVTLDNVKNQINEQLSKISALGDVTASVDGNKISISSSVAGKEVKLTAASDSILNNLNMEVGKVATSVSDIVVSELTVNTSTILSSSEQYIKFDYNGVQKTISLNSTVNESNLESYLQTEINKAYGAGKVVADVDENNKLSFTVTLDGSTNVFGVSGISKELSNLTGIQSGDYNRLSRSKTLEESGLLDIGSVSKTTLSNGKEGYILNINNVDIELEATMSVTNVINAINNNAEAGVKVYYSSTSDTFSVKATEAGTHKGISIVAGEGTLAQALFGSSGTDYTVKPGTDTIMTYTLNGVQQTITRSTANVTIDEMNIELNEKASTIDFTNSLSFDVTNNTDEVVERVKQFINDYNEIINLIGTKTKEKPNRNYLPLTPDQQDEMEEKEIENWTTEAKKGVLYGDSKMNNVMRNMRGTMAGFTDVSSLTLSNIGISSARMDTSGKLVFDEAKFKEKLLENPNEIANLFTVESTAGSEAKSGIALQLQSLLKENIGNYGTTGLLVEEAGLAGNMTADKNYISEKIEDHDDKMAELKKALEAERKRYWNKFSALESSLNRLNTQSSWLTDSMGQ